MSSHNQIIDGIEHSIITTDDEKDIVGCLVNAFYYEPMGLELGITKEELATLALHLASVAAELGTSSIAKTSEGQVAGLIIAHDMNYELSIPEGLSEKFNPIFQLLAKLDEDLIPNLDDDLKDNILDENGKIIDECLLHMLIGAVIPGVGKGILTNQTKFITSRMKQRGYYAAMCEATGPISQHVTANKLGYTPIASIDYGDFEYNGRKPFASLPHNNRSRDGVPCESCVMMIKVMQNPGMVAGNPKIRIN